MQRRQVAETANGFRLYEGTRERCFAPIRERQILRHDVNLSRYQVEGPGPGANACGRESLRRASLRRATACGPKERPDRAAAVRWASAGPRLAVCAKGASASRGAVVVPRTGARRSSLEALSRGRWASRASFGGWGRCGRLFSAPPMCQAGWSRGSWGCGRGRLLSGGRFKTPRPFRAAPRKRGACAAAGTAAHFRKAGIFAHFSRKMHAFCTFSPENCPCSARQRNDTGSPGSRIAGRTSLHMRARRRGPCSRFSGVRPAGGHTPQNLTLSPASYQPGRMRPGCHAAGSGDAPSPNPPALSQPGKGTRGHGIRAAGNRLRAGSAAAQVTACGPGNAPNRPAVPFVVAHDTHGLSLRQGPQKNPDGIFLLLPLDPSTSRGCVGHAERQNKPERK